ncbi:MAG: hypothetical protein HKL81_00300 [Acidimicrobiaceae bacterium]|nr:hypothetical protein [Acidimicrobiaceae bacterium]
MEIKSTVPATVNGTPSLIDDKWLLDASGISFALPGANSAYGADWSVVAGGASSAGGLPNTKCFQDNEMTIARSEEVLIAGSDLEPGCGAKASAKLFPTPLKAVGSNSTQIAFVIFSATSRGILP